MLVTWIGVDMRLRIEYQDGTAITLEHVESIRIISASGLGSSFAIQCFGNAPVTYRYVQNIDILSWGDID